MEENEAIENEEAQDAIPSQANVNPITPDEIRKLIRSELKEGLQQWDREQQALRAKLRNKINREVERQFEALREAGIDPTQEQKQKIYDVVQNSIVEEYGQKEQQLNGQDNIGAETNVDDDNATLQYEVADILKEVGVEVLQNDPEFLLIDFDAKTKYAFLRSVEKAAREKYERLANEGKKIGNPAAAPALVGRGESAELKSKYIQEMISARGQGHIVGKSIKDKYRKLGVNVDEIDIDFVPVR